MLCVPAGAKLGEREVPAAMLEADAEPVRELRVDRSR
jgi:hypothetical protein